jgi:peptidoglycan hydrolase CwlO-like protein
MQVTRIQRDLTEYRRIKDEIQGKVSSKKAQVEELKMRVNRMNEEIKSK